MLCGKHPIRPSTYTHHQVFSIDLSMEHSTALGLIVARSEQGVSLLLIRVDIGVEAKELE